MTTVTDGLMLGEDLQMADADDGADPRALLEAHFGQFYATVYRYLLHRVFDRERAEELTAETFYRAAASIARVPADIRHMQHWLLRIATNVASTHYRRARWRRLLFERFARGRSRATRPADESETDADDRQQAVRAVLRELPLRHQTVLALRYYSQMSFADMAAILKCREPAVRVRLSRAVKELRRRLAVQAE